MGRSSVPPYRPELSLGDYRARFRTHRMIPSCLPSTSPPRESDTRWSAEPANNPHCNCPRREHRYTGLRKSGMDSPAHTIGSSGRRCSLVSRLEACSADVCCDHGKVDDVDFSVQIQVRSWVYTCGNSFSEIT